MDECDTNVEMQDLIEGKEVMVEIEVNDEMW